MPWLCWTMETLWTVPPLLLGLPQEDCRSCSCEASQVVIIVIEISWLLSVDQGHS